MGTDAKRRLLPGSKLHAEDEEHRELSSSAGSSRDPSPSRHDEFQGGDGDDEEDEEDSDVDEKRSQTRAFDRRYGQQPPSRFKRSLLLLFVAGLLWLAFRLRGDLHAAKKKPQIIYASRYSKEHKFRPAASPIITETLKDGRIRLRGAQQFPTATPTPVVKKTSKKGGKRKGRKKSTVGTERKAGKKP